MKLSSNETGRTLGMSGQAVRDYTDAGRLHARRVGIQRLVRIQIDDQ